MAHWVIAVPSELLANERLFANESLPIAESYEVGDRVVLLADGSVVGLGEVTAAGVAAYTHRMFDEPVPAPDLGAGPLSAADFERLAEPAAAVDAPKREWLVSVDLPIEASSRAEAVRLFWSYVVQLGPRELPAFVAPADDELAMTAYVLGEETELDPEEAEEY